MTTIIRPKNHDEWLDLRKGGIGSSEVGSVLGVNPYETPYQLWLRKTGRIAAKEQNMAMRLGHLMEGTVAQLYEDATGNIVDTATEGDWCVKNEARPYTIASPDRYCITPDGKTILLECKTTRKNVSEESTPMSWYCQVQYLLYCSGLDEGALAWLKYGSEFGYKSINANPEFQEFMLERLDRFWTDCIIGDKAPAAISGGDVSLIYATSVAGKTIEADVETLQKIAALKEKKEAAKALEDEISGMEDEIKLYMRDADILTANGETICTWKTGKGRATLDRKKLAAEHPEIIQEYTKAGTPVRTFLIK